MFCDKCGREVRSDQKFCSACGKEMAPMGLPAPASRLQRHLHLLGVLWVVYAVLGFIGFAAISMVSHFVLPGLQMHHPPDFPGFPLFMHSLFRMISIFILIKAVGSVLVGFGLLNRQPWARTLAVIWSILAMLNIPFGMALGIYTLWVLMSPSADEEYRRITAAS
jgi:hypothetical protein